MFRRELFDRGLHSLHGFPPEKRLLGDVLPLVRKRAPVARGGEAGGVDRRLATIRILASQQGGEGEQPRLFATPGSREVDHYAEDPRLQRAAALEPIERPDVRPPALRDDV